MAGTATDTIRFSVTGSIILKAGLPRITSDLTITGPTAKPGITIDGDNKYQVMEVGESGELHLNNLTITRGKANNISLNQFNGGGVYSQGTMTVTDCTFSDNFAIGQGGGIASSRSYLTINRSTFSGNSAGAGGGGMFNFGPAKVVNSTF